MAMTFKESVDRLSAAFAQLSEALAHYRSPAALIATLRDPTNFEVFIRVPALSDEPVQVPVILPEDEVEAVVEDLLTGAIVTHLEQVSVLSAYALQVAKRDVEARNASTEQTNLEESVDDAE